MSDSCDHALDESVKVLGAVDGRSTRNEGHHYPVNERQDGDRLIFNQSWIRCVVGRMPLGDNVARERVELSF
jgi:hypothetical protein